MLMLTVNRLYESGISSFSFIHDSYGTHACDTDELNRVLRETFIEIYKTHDVLRDFKEEQQRKIDEPLEDLPEYGKLDLEEVIHSKYFFS